MLIRPCFLVIDHDFAGSISTRKLVIETAKFNVITVYSCEEASATLERFPRVHAVVCNATMGEHDCSGFLQKLRGQYPHIKLVAVGMHHTQHIPADRTVESFSPDKLLSVLRELFPEQADAVQQSEDELELATGIANVHR